MLSSGNLAPHVSQYPFYTCTASGALSNAQTEKNAINQETRDAESLLMGLCIDEHLKLHARSGCAIVDSLISGCDLVAVDESNGWIG